MRRVLLACVPLLLAIPTRAAPPNADPNWPCQQIKVPELSVAAMWTGPPIDPYFATWAEDPSVADLVRRVTQRRLPIEQAKAEVAAFAQQQGQDKLPKLLALFAGVFDSLNRERTSILAGLDRFGARQKQLAASIRGENEQLQALRAAAQPDPKQLDDLTQRLTWDLTVFQDRRESLGFACNAPTLVEQRLFALAQAIQAGLH